MPQTDDGRTADEFRFYELCWHSQAELKIKCGTNQPPFLPVRAESASCCPSLVWPVQSDPAVPPRECSYVNWYDWLRWQNVPPSCLASCRDVVSLSGTKENAWVNIQVHIAHGRWKYWLTYWAVESLCFGLASTVRAYSYFLSQKAYCQCHKNHTTLY